MQTVSVRTAQRQRKAAGIARPPGPAPSADEFKRIRLALDETTYQAVIAAGDGTFTSGLRALVKYFSDNAK